MGHVTAYTQHVPSFLHAKSTPFVGFPRNASKSNFHSINVDLDRHLPFNTPKIRSFEAIPQPESTKHMYSVWAFPPEDVGVRMKKLMTGLRSDFGGPEFEPHITVLGAISLTANDALKKFRSACEGLKAYDATVDRMDTDCLYLLIHPTTEVVETSDHCISHFGYWRSSPYMPHLSLLYGDLSDVEKKKAEERANSLDDSLSGLSFKINRLALYKTDTEDKTLKSWEKIAECTLSPN